MALTVRHKFVSPKVEQADPTIVGPNEWNDTHIVIGADNDKIYNAVDFDFTVQTPGSNLTAGLTSFAMNPVPPGVLANDSLYISGGTGAAEVVQVNSVVGTVVTVICANSHSGAWTVQSATDGIQEAELFRVVNGGIVYMPAGSYLIRDPIKYYDYAVFHGQGAATILLAPSSTATIFLNRNTATNSANTQVSNNIVFLDFRIDAASFITNTVYGIRMNLYTGTDTQSICDVLIYNISFNNIRYSVYGERVFDVTVDNCSFFLSSGIILTDTNGDPTYRNFNNTLVNLTFNYESMAGTGAANLNDYYIILNKCVTCIVDNVVIAGTMGVAGGINLRNSCEGVVISNLSVEMFGISGNPFYGIYIQETNQDGRVVSPSTVQITNVVIDMVFSAGIVWEASFFHATDLKIANALVTSHPSLGGNNGIIINGTTIQGVSIGTSSVYGKFNNACIWLAQAPDDIVINGCNLFNSHATGVCLKNDPSVDNLVVTSNTTIATSGNPLLESYGVPANRFYWANAGPNLIPNFMHPKIAWPMYTYGGGVNAVTRYYNGIDTGVDYSGFVHNYNRSNATTGTIDNASFGTAEIQYYGQFTNFGLVKLRSGFTNSQPTDVLVASGAGITEMVAVNYIGNETGANNAITGTLPGVVLSPGLEVRVKLAHTLQAGGNTFNFNSSGGLAIVSSRSLGNITTAYAVGGIITVIYDGTRWLDKSQ